MYVYRHEIWHAVAHPNLLSLITRAVYAIIIYPVEMLRGMRARDQKKTI